MCSRFLPATNLIRDGSAAMVTITVVIAGVVYAKPTPMRPVPFSRDIMFLLIAHLMILGSTTAGAISVSASGDEDGEGMRPNGRRPLESCSFRF